MKNKIIFIGDINRAGQASNIFNLEMLFSAIFEPFNIDIKRHISKINAVQETQKNRTYWNTFSDSDVFIELEKINFLNAAVIGFEMPKSHQNYFKLNDIPWVNLEIHPLRFLEDLCFSVTSSFEYNHDKNIISDVQIKYNVNKIKLKAFKNNKDNHIQSNEGKLLILGQSPYDKSVWYDNEFKNLTHYIEQIDGLISQCKEVFYRPHPYLTDKKIDEIITKKYDLSILNSPDYYSSLLINRFTLTCSISSSSVFESRSFGLEGIYLEKRKKDYGPAISYSELLSDKDFWYTCFLKRDIKNVIQHAIITDKGIVRETYGYWSYVDKQKIIENECVSLNENFNRLSNQVDILNEKLADVKITTDKINELKSKLEGINSFVKLILSIKKKSFFYVSYFFNNSRTLFSGFFKK